MRAALLPLLALTACGSPIDPPFDGSGGAGFGSGGEYSTGGADASTGGAASGGETASGGVVGSGGAPTGGTTSSGGSSGGETASGGAQSGGADSSGGAPPGPAPCEPPSLPAFTSGQPYGYGDDVGGLCGWTSSSAPAGYHYVQLECGADTTGSIDPWKPELGGNDLVTYVSVLDPGDRCQGEADRAYAVKDARYRCLRLSTPFAVDDIDDSSSHSTTVLSSGEGSATCQVIAFASTTSTPDDASLGLTVNLDEPGWVRVDWAELDGASCPLSCE